MKHESPMDGRRQIFALLAVALALALLLAACGTLEVELATTPEATRLRRGGVTPTPNFDEPQYATEAGVVFDDRLELVGYTVEPAQSGPVTEVTVTLIWQVLDIVPANYHTFVHAFNAQEQLLAQVDGPTGGGLRFSKDWIVREYVYDQHRLQLPSGMGLDDLQLRVGLYDADQGERARVESPTSFTLNAGSPPADAPPAPSPTGTPLALDEAGQPDELAAGKQLRVAYLQDADVWIWEEGRGSRQLTKDGGADGVWLSDDGQWTAFRREGQIWAIRSDGGDERQVTRAEDFQDMAVDVDEVPQVGGLNPVNLAWRPGSHELYFNTSPDVADLGQFLSDDLWRYDADGGVLEMVLAPGDGGNFLFAPDGEQLALIAPGRIELMNADGSARRVVFMHPPVTTGSEYAYYARPVWSADARALAVAIPLEPSSPVEAGPSGIWRIPVDGGRAQLLGEVTTLPGLQTPPLIAPDLHWIAYLTGRGMVDSNFPRVAVAELDDLAVGEPFLVIPDAVNLHGWSPDSARLLYQSPAAGVMALSVSEQGARELFAGDDLGRVGDVRWTDKFRYLFIHYPGDGWEIRLGVVDGREPEVIAQGTSFPAGYDFAWAEAGG